LASYIYIYVFLVHPRNNKTELETKTNLDRHALEVSHKHDSVVKSSQVNLLC